MSDPMIGTPADGRHPDHSCGQSPCPHVSAPPEPPDGPDPREAIERTARFQDALDALNIATLWLHRTLDLPHMPSHQAESWERKARSGRVALSAALNQSENPDD